jgi:hypothetical protein
MPNQLERTEIFTPIAFRDPRIAPDPFRQLDHVILGDRPRSQTILKVIPRPA